VRAAPPQFEDLLALGSPPFHDGTGDAFTLRPRPKPPCQGHSR
jgi:hypothetical protein